MSVDKIIDQYYAKYVNGISDKSKEYRNELARFADRYKKKHKLDVDVKVGTTNGGTPVYQDMMVDAVFLYSILMGKHSVQKDYSGKRSFIDSQNLELIRGRTPNCWMDKDLEFVSDRQARNRLVVKRNSKNSNDYRQVFTYKELLSSVFEDNAVVKRYGKRLKYDTVFFSKKKRPK